MIRCGVAGWDYKSWKGTVYPERAGRGFDQLAYLARYVPVLEINRTYYRAASAEEGKRWLERIASLDATFTAKMPEQFVAPGRTWTKSDVEAARAGMDVLAEGGKLAAVILQFAHSFKRLRKDESIDERNAEWLRDVIEAFPGLPLFVEFRHRSWDAPDVLDQLREMNVGWVNVDQPMLFEGALPLSDHATTELGYLRMHGRNYKAWSQGSRGRSSAKTAENVEARKAKTKEERAAEEAQKDAKFDYLYTSKELDALAEVAQRIAKQPGVRDVVCVNNNHMLGKAPANALMLESIVRHEKVPAPPDLFREYEKDLAPYAYPAPIEPRGAVQATLPFGEPTAKPKSRAKRKT